jgi:hypothetical protein
MRNIDMRDSVIDECDMTGSNVTGTSFDETQFR